MASVRIQGLRRHFPGNARPAVADLDLEIGEGETLCLVGPSGCGKSTTLRMVAGLDVPDAGEIVIDGKSMKGVPPQARDVAMVFQGFALYPHMRVREILAFPLRMRSVSRSDQEKSIEETAKRLGITKLLDRRPAELSGGEQQRVAMGRAIVRRPKAFLFDEPLSNLDAALRSELRVYLGRLLRELEATAMYVTHDQAEAMTLGHRIAVMNAGKLEQVDTPRKIYEEPRTVFVASFFGIPPMNLLDAERDGDVARIGTLSLPSPPGDEKELVAGIRPEDVVVGDDGTPSLEARVAGVELLGAESHVELVQDGHTLRARVGGFRAPEPGENVSVRLPPDRIRWFSRKSGLAL